MEHLMGYQGIKHGFMEPIPSTEDFINLYHICLPI